MAPQLFVVRGFLDREVCAEVRTAMDHGVADTAEVLDGTIAEQHDVRRAASIEIDPRIVERVERLLDEQLPAIQAFFDVPLAGREGAGFLRYAPGGFYLPHRDRADDPAWPDAARRAITVVVFLNHQDFSGGVLRVGSGGPEGPPILVAPMAGTLVAFPSDELHEVTAVERGCRDAIVDWCLRPRASVT